MGLFDNLFKSKAPPGEESVVEAARRITETEKARLVEAEKAAKPAGQKPPGSGNRAAPAPVARAYSPRSLGQAVPVRPLSPVKGPAKAVRFGAAAEGGRPQEIRLLLDDVVARIPAELLNDEPRDGRKEVRFRVEDVTADIARGRAAVALGRIAEQVPEIFRVPIAPGDETLIRLPLQKLVEQIGFLPVKPAPPDAKTTRPPIGVQSLPGTRPPGAAVSLPPGPDLFKPKDKASPDAPVKPEESQGAMEPTLEARNRITPEPSLPAVESHGSGAANDAKISLSLAAILRECPKELIVAPLPPINEDDRISVPFAPIEKQLPTGLIEISSVRFVFALPPHLQHCFEAREGVRIPLPVDEVRRNLPEVATPVVDTPPPKPIRPVMAYEVPEPKPASVAADLPIAAEAPAPPVDEPKTATTHGSEALVPAPEISLPVSESASEIGLSSTPEGKAEKPPAEDSQAGESKLDPAAPTSEQPAPESDGPGSAIIEEVPSAEQLHSGDGEVLLPSEEAAGIAAMSGVESLQQNSSIPPGLENVAFGAGLPVAEVPPSLLSPGLETTLPALSNLGPEVNLTREEEVSPTETQNGSARAIPAELQAGGTGTLQSSDTQEVEQQPSLPQALPDSTLR